MGEENIIGKLRRREFEKLCSLPPSLMLFAFSAAWAGCCALGRHAVHASQFIEGFPVFVICNMGLWFAELEG